MPTKRAPWEEPSVSYRLKMIRCGKARCRCMKTDDQSQWHGPYWYTTWRNAVDEGGKVETAYNGRRREPRQDPPPRAPGAKSRRQPPPPRKKKKAPPGGQHRQAGGQRSHQAPPPSREVQDVRDAALLGVAPDVSKVDLKRAWRQKIAEVHPDRFPEGEQRQAKEREAQEINAAYQRMREFRGW